MQHNRGAGFQIVIGYSLIAVGVLHVGVWLNSGQAWEGATSWRKPILFGVSGGLTLVSTGRLLSLLRPWRIDKFLSVVIASCMATEVGIITLQQWRGVESHFNCSTQLDAFLDLSMTVLIAIVTVCILVLAFRSFCGGFQGTVDEKVAWNGGMFFLFISCAIGFVLYVYGVGRVEAGKDPSVYGANGPVKFPHGVAIHAIQLLPLLRAVLRRLGTKQIKRLSLLRSTTAALFLLLIYSIIQTLAGRERFDADLYSTAVLVLAFGLFLPVNLEVGYGLLRSLYRAGNQTAIFACELKSDSNAFEQ